MSAFAQGNRTPAKKKGSCFKPQTNTLDHYFHTPKKSTECKPRSAIKRKDTNSALLPKTENQPTNSDGVKRLKIDDSCQKKILPGRINNNQSKIYEAQVVLTRVHMIDEEKIKNHNVASTTVDCEEKEGTIHEINSIKNKIQSLQIENQNLKNKMTVIDSISLQMQSSINDSIEIDVISTPKQHKSTASSSYNFPLLARETEKNTRFSNEIFKTRASGLNKGNEISCVISENEYHKGTLPLQEKKKISATMFKEIIYSFCHNDFSKPYRKLSCSKLPECCDLEKCKAKHEGRQLREVNSFHHCHVFNNLDCPLSEWICDISPFISLVVTHDQYLRGDMLRVMFDYILNGPNEDLMWDVKALLESHWSLHPPCSDHMREVYLELLISRYRKESYFKTVLENDGVLLYVVDQMEKIIKLKQVTEVEVCGNSDETNDGAQNSNYQSTLTFAELEERFNNHEPLFEEEHQEIMDTLDYLANSSQQEEALKVLDKSQILNRLTIALQVIVDLLEADFMICVSRLKNYMKGECEIKEPLIKHFMNDSFQFRVLKLYVKMTDRCTWKQLSRLIGLMAETTNLFKHKVKRVWKYPDLNLDCEEFASNVIQEFNDGAWDESERLYRLQTLRPPWLQQRVTLAVTNSYLNLDLATGIQALVDIIHTHVISPVRLEKDLKKKEPDPDKLREMSESLKKKSKKRNQYGETLLHQLCRDKKRRVEDIIEDMECVLALPETDVNVRDNHGWTPLHETVASMSLAKTEVLLQFQPPPGSGKRPVDLGAQNNDGITALHDAVEGNNLEICKLLVEYGGICLLRKKNNEGITPLMLARNKEEIKSYFEKVIKVQEELNLNSNSVLKLPDPMIRLCMIVCEAFIADHHTWELYQVLKFDKEYDRPPPQPWIPASSKDILIEFKQDQDQFRKLRRILEKLAENPENSYLVTLWNDRFLCKERNH